MGEKSQEWLFCFLMNLLASMITLLAYAPTILTYIPTLLTYIPTNHILYKILYWILIWVCWKRETVRPCGICSQPILAVAYPQPRLVFRRHACPQELFLWNVFLVGCLYLALIALPHGFVIYAWWFNGICLKHWARSDVLRMKCHPKSLP